MKIYEVGGAVRDELLGRTVQDRDYVVVGATPEEMVALGYRPVGKDFPVFLHPVSHAEHALARTERKVSAGYHGFEVYATPQVTLEEDLQRRDLTINAMARDENGVLVDPYGGRSDLEAGVLRHVGPAFVEDPVRILRVARFAARFGFAVADETMGLMRRMAVEGELDALVPERIWQELARGLMEREPSRMFAVLRDCGALARVLPEIDRLFGVPQSPASHPEIDTGVHVMMVVDDAAARGHGLEVRFAALVHDLGKGTTPPELWPRHPGHEARGVELVEALCARIRVPGPVRDLGVMATRAHGTVHGALDLDANGLLELLQSTDAVRRPERFAGLIEAAASDFHGRPGWADQPYPQGAHLLDALEAARSVPAGIVASAAPPGGAADAVKAARLAALQAFLDGRRGLSPHL